SILPARHGRYRTPITPCDVNPTFTSYIFPMIRLILPRLVLVWVLLLQGMATVCADNINLPDLDDDSAAVISPSQDRPLGAEFMRQVRQAQVLVDDPEI